MSLATLATANPGRRGMYRNLTLLLTAAGLALPAQGGFAHNGGQGGRQSAESGASAERGRARRTFNRSAAAPTARPRAAVTRLPYRAIPVVEQRHAARAGLMARQIRATTGRNRVSINSVDGKVMVVDVAARRPSGERHYDKSTGRTVRLPHVRIDRIVTDTAPGGRRYARVQRGDTREASIQQLRTARRFAERQARARATARRVARTAR